MSPELVGMSEDRPRLSWQTRVALPLGLGVLLALAVFIARQQGGDRLPLYALVRTAVGVREGTRVTYRGVDIGRVERLAFTDSGVLLKLAIDERRQAPLRRGDTLRTAANGIFGDQVVRIVPGAPSAPLLGAGDTLRTFPNDVVAQAVNEALIEAIRREMFDSARGRSLEARSRRDTAADSLGARPKR